MHPLFEPLRIGNVTRASVPGNLIIAEATVISAAAGGVPHAPSLFIESQILAWKKITDAVHAKGSYVFCQLIALGRAADSGTLRKEGGFEVSTHSPIPKEYGYYVLISSVIAFALGPAFFLPQTSNAIYWALSFPGIILVAFGPDMSFTAASIFVPSQLPRSFQGSAGSLLVTMQNLSSAIFTANGNTIGESSTKGEGYSLDLNALRALWWVSLATSLLGTLVSGIFVRIPKAEEKEHLQ